MNKVVHFGAGNIGRGFLGQLYSQSGWETVFVDVDDAVVSAMNARRGYDIEIVGERCHKVSVRNVRAMNGREMPAVAAEIATADLLGTSVGVNALKFIAPVIARGLVARQAKGGQPVSIVICENLLNAGQVLRGMIRDALAPAAQPYLAQKVGFVETVISRMVPVVPDEKRRQDPLYVAVEEYAVLPVDRRGFVGPVPDIHGFEPHDNLHAYEERKIFTHNCAHALCSYLGYRKGHHFICETVADDVLRLQVVDALWESGEALVKKHGFTRQQHQEHIDDLLRRFANKALGDTVARCGRDPIRKLGPNDRLVGSAKLALEYGVQPRGLVKGIVAALRYDNPEDEKAVELAKLLCEKGLAHVLETICGLKSDERLALMVRKEWASSAA
ncbi:MAG: mannitol-1-phosphate 5-dehydrogenase [Planctomycetes bacterium]|nr:mannitol-1-phosphate 5-dehydrogenase [Planctomycetota bacterium]MBM4078890.1 mannitol-1-phosphate 5-dehydrogenase [Planctomycetota bacterium]MBM4086183.1 mannitol-1-phosphate 5-dehydrogenase [Planctomycetota bacterium]